MSTSDADPDANRGWVQGVVTWAISHPRAAISAWVGAALLASLGVASLKIDTKTDSILDRRAPAWRQYQRALKLFGGDEVVVIALRGAEAFEKSVLEQVARISAELQTLEGVRRVDSLATVPLISATKDGGLELDPALQSDADGSLGVRRRSEVLTDHLARRVLVSDTGETLAIGVQMEAGREDEFPEIVARIREVAGPDAAISGVPVFRTEGNRRTQRELLLFVPITILLIGGLLYAVFRSWVAVWIPLLGSGLASWVTLGVLGATGRSLTASSMILPSILLALGCAYTMHVLTAARGQAARSELDEAVRAVCRPIAFSGLTTAIGFLGIATVRIEAAQELGAFGALGVILVLCAALTIAPALLSLWSLPARDELDGWIRTALVGGIVRVARFSGDSVIAGSLVVMVVLALGLTRTRVNTDLTTWFQRGSEVRDSYERIKRDLSGISPVNVVVDAPEGRAVWDAHAVAAIEGLTEHLESLDAVGKAISYTGVIRQVHRGFSGDPGAAIPADEALVQQYLMLIEGVPQMGDLLVEDGSSANIVLRVDDNGSAELRRVADAAESWWAESGPPGFSATSTGIMFEFARAEDAVAYGQLQGVVIALAVIGLILLAIFRKFLVAGVALVPNVVPLVMVFGGMGWIGIPLDMGNIVLGSLALGIAVDDTIHVVSDYANWRRRGAGAVEAVVQALRRTMPALVYTTVAIVIGFGVLGLSSFSATRNLGLVTAALVSICLIADVMLLPALLLRYDSGESNLKSGS